MGILNEVEAKISAAQIGFNTIFAREFAQLSTVDPVWQQMAMETKSIKKVEQYNWLGKNPPMREWTSERNIAKLRAYGYSIRNRKWANGIEVDQDDIDDDALGLYGPAISELATEAYYHRSDLLMQLLISGFATTNFGACYDGKAFFATDHQDSSGPSQGNKGTSALSTNTYRAAWESMLELRDENKHPMRVMPTHLVVGPKLRATARDLLLAERNANGASNTDYQTVQLVVSQQLQDGIVVDGNDTQETVDAADMWFLLDLSRPIKPLIFQMRKEIQWRSVVGPDSADKFLTDKLYFGCDGRYNAGYGLWQRAYGANP